MQATTPDLLPTGLLVELVTPLTAAGAVDAAGLKRLVRQALPAAAAFVAGTPGVGEALQLAPELRLALFQELLRLVPPSLPLFFGLTAASPAATQDLAQELERVLAATAPAPPVYWVDLPLIYHSNRGLPQQYRELGGRLTRPLVLLNQPELVRGRSRLLQHPNLRTAVLKKLAGLAVIRGLIYHGSLRRFLHYYAAVATRPEFIIYEADERRFLTRPGSRGLVSATAVLFPRPWQQLVKACLFLQEDNEVTPQQLWDWSQIVLRLVRACRFHPAALLKAALQHLGLLEQAALGPGTPMPPPETVREFLALVTEAGKLLPG